MNMWILGWKCHCLLFILLSFNSIYVTTNLCFVPISIGCVRLLRGRSRESNSAPQATPPYPDRSAPKPDYPCLKYSLASYRPRLSKFLPKPPAGLLLGCMCVVWCTFSAAALQVLINAAPAARPVLRGVQSSP